MNKQDVHEAWIHSMDIQHENIAWIYSMDSGHAARIYSMDISIIGIDMHHGHEHAVWTSKCSIDKDMHRVSMHRKCKLPFVKPAFLYSFAYHGETKYICKLLL